VRSECSAKVCPLHLARSRSLGCAQAARRCQCSRQTHTASSPSLSPARSSHIGLVTSDQPRRCVPSLVGRGSTLTVSIRAENSLARPPRPQCKSSSPPSTRMHRPPPPHADRLPLLLAPAYPYTGSAHATAQRHQIMSTASETTSTRGRRRSRTTRLGRSTRTGQSRSFSWR
jgi:hypothetical protein